MRAGPRAATCRCSARALRRRSVDARASGSLVLALGGGLLTRARRRVRPAARRRRPAARGAAPARHRADRDGGDGQRIERALRRSPRSSTSSPAPARPRSPPIRWASSRATSTSRSSRASEWRSGLTKADARAARSREIVERDGARDGGGGLAADPDAHQRADRRRSLRRRRARSTARTSTSCSSSASRRSRRAEGRPRRRPTCASSRAAGLTLPARSARTGRGSRATASRSRTSTVVTETMAVGRAGRHGVRGGPALRAGGARPRFDYQGDLDVVARAAAQVDARARSSRSATSPT